MDPGEIEFLAESLPVTVVPNFSEGTMYLLCGEVGPFRAGLPLQVPLWLAVSLRSRGRCRLPRPDFLSPDRLEEVREAEKASPFFSPLPSEHLFSAAQLLLDVGARDMGADADKIRTLLKDIWDIRQAKLRKSVDAFVQSGLQHAKLDHLQLMELNSVRPLLPDALDAINRVEAAAAKARRVRANSSANSQQLNSSSFNRSSY